MTHIPKIIHQIAEECDDARLSEFFLSLSHTWKKNHPEWQYKLWDRITVENFVKENYPVIYSMYDTFKCDSRHLSDIARYLILNEEGGIFVDFDFECIEPIDDLIKGKHCSFSSCPDKGGKVNISDALIISSKGHSFLSFAISKLNKQSDFLDYKKDIFINKIYNLYDNKGDIDIIPFKKVNPCTQDEIKLYLARLITEEEMENNLSEALSICYYKKNNKPYSRKMDANGPVDVLYLSSVVGHHAGAFRAAHRIHLGLRTTGINSKLLVLGSLLSPKENQSDHIHVASPGQGEIAGFANDMKPLQAYPGYSIDSYAFAPAVAGIHVNRYIHAFDPKIVQLHSINAGFIDIENIGKIQKKIVWRLADCWAFTGGCYYFGNCKRYMTGCGNCPKLGSEDKNDLSHDIWKRKEKAWKNTDMTIVVPASWMKELVENSTLLNGREVFVIPNGLNIDEFYPIDKETARKALKIPTDKKIIVFGATNAFDPRKGLHLLLSALQSLSGKYKDEYFLVVFGSGSKILDLDIPVKFLGNIREHYILQLAYSAADVMIVPSLEEAFGQTVIEAMACATPVVSFEGTGPAGVIEHLHTGYLARYADVKDLSCGIEWVLENAYRMDFLSANARHQIETTYDIRLIANQYRKLYDKINNTKII